MVSEAFHWTAANWPAALVALVPAALNLAVLVYVLAFGKRNQLTYTFALFVAGLTVWQFSDALVRLSATAEGASFWADALGIGALLIAPAGLHFTLLFTERVQLARSPWILGLLYGPAVLIEALTRGGLNNPMLVRQEPWGWVAALPTPLVNTLYGIWIASLAIVILALLAGYAWRTASGDPRRKQALLVAAGFAVPTIQGTVTQVVFPTLLGIPPVPIASTVMTTFTLATLIALRRYQFLAGPTVEERLRETQEALRQEERFLADSQRIAHIGSWSWDMAANRVVWSEEMYRIYGYEDRSFPVTFEKAMERVVPEDAQRIGQDLRRQLGEAEQAFRQGGRTEFVTSSIDYRVVVAPGVERVLHGEGRLTLDAGGRPIRMLGTVQDVTEQKRAERERQETLAREREVERLREINEFKTQFINTAAHELNTPLTPIRVILHLLTKEAKGVSAEERRRAMEILIRNVDRLQRLVGDLLDSARIQAQRLLLRKEAVVLGPLIDETVESFALAAKEAGVRLEAAAGPAIHVEADPSRITQVLYNLVGNALKFTPRGGLVRIDFARQGGDAIVRVEDTGIGMTPEQGARLFLPFTQVHDPAITPPENRGTGLGLYICRGILELHGGRIWCESPGSGRGSTFTFALPTIESRENAAARVAATSGSSPVTAASR